MTCTYNNKKKSDFIFIFMCDTLVHALV